MASTVEAVFRAGQKKKTRQVGYIMAGGFYPAFAKNTKLRYRAQVSAYDQIKIRARGAGDFLRTGTLGGRLTPEETTKGKLKVLKGDAPDSAFGNKKAFRLHFLKSL